ELRVDSLRQLACRGSAGVRAHDGPEQVVVEEAAAVVLYCLADVLGHSSQVGDQFLCALVGQLGVLLDGGVEVVGVRGMVLVVMYLHRAGVDVRLQRVGGVGQVG